MTPIAVGMGGGQIPTDTPTDTPTHRTHGLLVGRQTGIARSFSPIARQRSEQFRPDFIAVALILGLLLTSLRQVKNFAQNNFENNFEGALRSAVRRGSPPLHVATFDC
jgi:hypothetical protein